MRILLDTCIFLFFINGDNRLPDYIINAICSSDNQILLSVISEWEIMVKYQIGKLHLPESPSIYIPTQRNRHDIASLPLDEESVIQLHKLPLIHRDPFDRMLICQAIQHNLVIATVDNVIISYPELKTL